MLALYRSRFDAFNIGNVGYRKTLSGINSYATKPLWSSIKTKFRFIAFQNHALLLGMIQRQYRRAFPPIPVKINTKVPFVEHYD